MQHPTWPFFFPPPFPLPFPLFFLLAGLGLDTLSFLDFLLFLLAFFFFFFFLSFCSEDEESESSAPVLNTISNSFCSRFSSESSHRHKYCCRLGTSGKSLISFYARSSSLSLDSFIAVAISSPHFPFISENSIHLRTPR